MSPTACRSSIVRHWTRHTNLAFLGGCCCWKGKDSKPTCSRSLSRSRAIAKSTPHLASLSTTLFIAKSCVVLCLPAMRLEHHQTKPDNQIAVICPPEQDSHYRMLCKAKETYDLTVIQKSKNNSVKSIMTPLPHPCDPNLIEYIQLQSISGTGSLRKHSRLLSKTRITF